MSPKTQEDFITVPLEQPIIKCKTDVFPSNSSHVMIPEFPDLNYINAFTYP